MNQIGSKVRELRLAADMTQAEFATRCDLVGLNISRGTVSKIESQVRRITNDEVEYLAKALKVGVSELYK